MAKFINILAEYGITATPRTRRGIDINAGCGQLKSELLRKTKSACAPKTNIVDAAAASDGIIGSAVVATDLESADELNSSIVSDKS